MRIGCQATPGAVFSIPLEELKISPVTREYEVRGYRDRITVMLMVAQPLDAGTNLEQPTDGGCWSTAASRSPETTTGVTRYLLMVRALCPGRGVGGH